MSSDERDVVDQAIAWHLRQNDMGDDDWHAFTLWIAADPAHAAAFDRIVTDDGLLDLRGDTPAARPIAANDDDGTRRTRRRVAWSVVGAVAAVVCGAYLLPAVLPQAASPYEITTAAGQRQELALADGTRIELSGGTTLALDRADPRVADLRGGEAIFHVRHDAAHPFTLHAGGLTVRDMGTVFNVAKAGSRLTVAVAEGSVLFQPDAEAVTLTPGSALSTLIGSNRVVLSHVDVGAVGEWREGRLSFAGAPLAEVVAAVRRQSGLAVDLAPALASRPFTGMVRLTGAADRDVPHLAALIGASATRDRGVWVLEPVENAAP